MTTNCAPSRFLSLVLAAVLALPVFAYGQAGGATIQVEGAWSRRAAMMKGDSGGGGSGNGAVYALLVNAGNAPDALVGVASDVSATAEIHETYRHMNMMMMRAIGKIDVPAGGKVEMKPGSYHIMLLNLKRDLKPGETIGVTLQFEKAGKIPVTATVK
jgi:periplasmic copper chaperone A